MRDVVAVDDGAGSVDERPDVRGELADPDAVGGGACCETAWVVAVDVRVFVVAEAVDFVSDGLVDAGCGVDAVDEFAWEGLGVALTGREIVVVVVKTGVET